MALMKAARNIARRQVAAAVGDTDYDADAATKATLVDLQISAYAGGSSDTTLEVVPVPSPHGGLQLFENFGAQIVRELLSCIRDEAQGRRRDRFIGEYLRALPKGLSLQTYQVTIDGKADEPLEIRDMRLLDLPEPPTALVKLSGMVDGVSFGEKSEPSVRFAPWVGKTYALSATKAQVEDAVRLRGEKVDALVLMAERPKLLWLRKADQAMASLSAPERQRYLFDRWDRVLSELAK